MFGQKGKSLKIDKISYFNNFEIDADANYLVNKCSSTALKAKKGK